MSACPNIARSRGDARSSRLASRTYPKRPLESLRQGSDRLQSHARNVSIGHGATASNVRGACASHDHCFSRFISLHFLYCRLQSGSTRNSDWPTCSSNSVFRHARAERSNRLREHSGDFCRIGNLRLGEAEIALHFHDGSNRINCRCLLGSCRISNRIVARRSVHRGDNRSSTSAN